MTGVLGAALAASGVLASRTLTVGDDGVDSYGYSSAGAYGSLAPAATYVDRGGTTRTILTLAYNTSTGNLVLTLSGSVANSNVAFAGLLVGSSYLSRASASYSSPSNSIWTWSPGSNIIGTSGSKLIQFL